MRKVFFLLFIVLATISAKCLAIDPSSNLLSLINLSRESATPKAITAMLGEPTQIEQGKKRIWWHYSHENTTLTICWNKNSNLFENFSFSCANADKSVFDTRLSGKLKSGSTDLQQAIKLLGTPKDMKIKGATQEMHYAYQNSVLRLFFRNRVLVDYTLLGQASK